MNKQAQAESWIGASLLRKEDARHLHGHGMFIADVRMPGVQDVAFVRSQMAHARVRQRHQARRTPRHGFSRLPTSARSTSWKPARNSPPIATAPIRRWPTSGCAMSGRPIAACVHADARAGRGSRRPGRASSSKSCRPSSMSSPRCGRQPARVRRLADNAYISTSVDRRRSRNARRGADPAAPPVAA